MQYDRQCGSIQASLARRAGLLLRQYSQLSSDLPEQQKLDATLTVSVLSLLLVNCDQALAMMKRDGHVQLLWRDVRTIVLRRAVSTFPVPINDAVESDALSHLRNAVSHPLAARHDGRRLTGYTAQPVDSHPTGLIERFEFVASPWVDEAGVLSSFRSGSRQKVKSALGRFEKKYKCDGVLQVDQLDDGSYAIVETRSGEPYLPEFVVSLDLAQMESLALSMANFLAHGALPSWEGEVLMDLLTG